jgi:hypothetical protein
VAQGMAIQWLCWNKGRATTLHQHVEQIHLTQELVTMSNASVQARSCILHLSSHHERPWNIRKYKKVVLQNVVKLTLQYIKEAKFKVNN